MSNDIFNAISNDDIKKVKLLLDSGVSVDCKFSCDKNPITFFIESHLIDNYTPLIKAVMKRNIATVKLLLKYGANMYLVDNLDTTAQDWANGQSEIEKILNNAIMVGCLVEKNKFDELYKILAKESIRDRYLLGYALFQFRSKNQFEKLKKECTKNGILNVEQLMYHDISPRLLTHCLKLNIWTWNDKMFTVFPTLRQKKEMIIYTFNDTSIARIPYYDMKIKYNN